MRYIVLVVSWALCLSAFEALAHSYTEAQYCALVIQRRNAWPTASGPYRDLEAERVAKCSRGWGRAEIAQWEAPYTGELHPLLFVAPPTIRSPEEIAEAPAQNFRETAAQCKRVGHVALDQCNGVISKNINTVNSDFHRNYGQNACLGEAAYEAALTSAVSQSRMTCQRYQSECQSLCSSADVMAEAQGNIDDWVRHDLTAGQDACRRIGNAPNEVSQQNRINLTALKTSCDPSKTANNPKSTPPPLPVINIGNGRGETSTPVGVTPQLAQPQDLPSDDVHGYRSGAMKHSNNTESAPALDSPVSAGREDLFESSKSGQFAPSQVSGYPNEPARHSGQKGKSDSVGTGVQGGNQSNAIFEEGSPYFRNRKQGAAHKYDEAGSNVHGRKLANTPSKSVDLNRFLPTLGKATGPDGITGPHSDIFKKIRGRYQVTPLQ